MFDQNWRQSEQNSKRLFKVILQNEPVYPRFSGIVCVQIPNSTRTVK